MALRQRTYFFDAGNADRFNSQDIPTEQTMSDWCDSVPFIKEITDRAQLTRAGIAKTTTDAKINTGDNVDAAGVSPLGFTSFVRPAQIPKILDSSSITWTKVARGGATNTDTGVGIEDWRASFDYSTLPDVDTSEVLLDANKSVRILTGGFPCSMTDAEVTTNAGDPLNDYLSDLRAAINQANQTIISLSNTVCDLQNNVDTQVALGDVVMSVTSSGSWSDKWLEPNGDEISIAAYPDLYAIIGFNYGVPSTPGFFKLPDLVSAPNNQNYLRARTNTGLLLPGNINGGSVLRTLDENDLPKHIHTVTGTALSAGEHQHSWPVYDTSGATQTGKIDGHAGNTDSQTFTTPLTGAHTHNLSGTTDDFVVDVPNEVWNTNTNVTPRYTNVYLKMRVK